MSSKIILHETNKSLNRSIVFFDGVCNLCNHWVKFILRNDKQKKILLTPLQSAAAEKILKHEHQYEIKTDSVIVLHNGKIYDRSNAALKICELLGGRWKLLLVFHLVPKFIRDAVYDYVARKRYKWYGKTEVCMLPDENVKERFLID